MELSTASNMLYPSVATDTTTQAFMNGTTQPIPLPGSDGRHVTVVGQYLISCCYLFGISGNVCALVILGRSETLRNKKQTLMLRCLAWNDLIALVGSGILMYLQLYMGQKMAHSRSFCVLRVFWRTFGLGSGSIAVVMAVERCLALTSPFLYQQTVTHKRIRRTIFSLWAIVIVLVCLPFAGFGLYYDEHLPETKCIRYRNAVDPKDVAYAFLFFSFGLMMCICIVGCNMAVVRVLCQLGGSGNSTALARSSRTTTTHRSTGSGELKHKYATQEELAFAKLMAIICIFFVVCWLPQMITIVMAQIDHRETEKLFYRLADIFIALNFSLDPYIYVLFRRRRRRHKCLVITKLFGRHCFSNSTTSGSPSNTPGGRPTNGSGTQSVINNTDSARSAPRNNSKSSGGTSFCST